MQRIFSTFPGALPGVGLLILRLFLGTSVLIHSLLYLSNNENPSVWILLGCLAGVGCGTFLIIGFLTPIVSVLTGLTAAIILASGLVPFPVILASINLSAVCSILVASAIVFLGPGAFSVDARLFGRREIIIPPSSRQPRL